MTRKSMLALLIVIVQIVCGCAVFAGAEAPAETVDAVPAETPAETTADTPAEAPAETAAETPAETTAEAPAEIPAETLVEAALPAQTAYTVTASFKPEIDAILGYLQFSRTDLDETRLSQYRSILNLIENASVRISSTGEEEKWDILLKDQPIAYLAARTTAEGVTLVTDVLPAYAVSLSYADLMKDSDLSPAAFADPRKFYEAGMNFYAGIIAGIGDGIESKLGEEESRFWMFDDALFFTRRPIEMSARELLIMIETAVKEGLENPQFSEILAAMGVGPEDMDMDRSIEQLQEASDDQLPVLTGYRYTNTAGDVWTDIVLSDESTSMTVDCATVSGKQIVRFKVITDQFQLLAGVKLGAAMDSYELDVAYTPLTQGPTPPVSVNISGTASSGEIIVSLMGVRLLSVPFTVTREAVIEASYERSKILDYNDISRIESDETMFRMIKTNAQIGIMTIVSKASAIMPDEVNVLMALIQENMD